MPNRKADVICDTAIVVHLSASMQAAEKSSFVLRAEKGGQSREKKA